MRRAIWLAQVWLLVPSLLVAFEPSWAATIEPCPIDLAEEDVETKCLTALQEAERSADTELQAQILERIAEICVRQRKWDNAIDLLRRSVPMSEHSHNASLRLADLLEQTGRLQDVSAVLESLVDQYDTSLPAEAWMRGGVELRVGDFLTRGKGMQLTVEASRLGGSFVSATGRQGSGNAGGLGWV